jgi:ferredoxin-NADP reductase
MGSFMRALLQPDLSSVPVAWDGANDDTLICRQVRQETHDVKTFVLGAQEPRLLRYAPGQFLTLELEIDGQRINRCYTLSSTPTRPDTVSITVKRVPGGPVSNWLHDNLKAGDRLRVLGPAGEFSCFMQPLRPQRKLLLLSAGSGITPLMSMARALHDLAYDADIVFVHSARTPADIIFAQELELIARNHPHFRLGFVCERRGEHPAWAGFNGYLNPSVLQNVAPDFAERDVFTCGPAPYMAAVRTMLRDSGYDMTHYHEESFTFDSPAAETAHLAGGPPQQVVVTAEELRHTVSFNLTGDEISCTSSQTIIEAASAAGLRLPVSCTRGMCGTCKTRMLSGQVEMHHGGGIRQREIDQGFILPCCSKPLSDVVLER